MSIHIRIELRDDEGIFTAKPMSRDELSALLMQALRNQGPTNIEGPFIDGVVQAFAIELTDPREQWKSTGSLSAQQSTAVHD